MLTQAMICEGKACTKKVLWDLKFQYIDFFDYKLHVLLPIYLLLPLPGVQPHAATSFYKVETNRNRKFLLTRGEAVQNF